MPLTRVSPGHAYAVDITWSRPAPYEQILANGSPHDADGWLYMILGDTDSAQTTIFYIGKVVATHVSRRLGQRDHRARFEYLCTKHPKNSFRVSIGAVHTTNGRNTPRRIDDIETLLIYATYDAHQPHMINKRKYFTHSIRHPFILRNLGSRKPLPKEVHLGVFTD